MVGPAGPKTKYPMSLTIAGLIHHKTRCVMQAQRVLFFRQTCKTYSIESSLIKNPAPDAGRK